MKDWKTTVPGILAGIVFTVRAIWPEYAQAADLAVGTLLSILGINAAQAK
jgi:hypothetical protein